MNVIEELRLEKDIINASYEARTIKPSSNLENLLELLFYYDLNEDNTICKKEQGIPKVKDFFSEISDEDFVTLIKLVELNFVFHKDKDDLWESLLPCIASAYYREIKSQEIDYDGKIQLVLDLFVDRIERLASSDSWVAETLNKYQKSFKEKENTKVLALSYVDDDDDAPPSRYYHPRNPTDYSDEYDYDNPYLLNSWTKSSYIYSLLDVEFGEREDDFIIDSFGNKRYE